MEPEVHKNLSEAFGESVLIEARRFSDAYRVIIEKNDDLGFIGSSVELPTVFADGKTQEECLKAIEQALAGAVATMIIDGRKPPQPSTAKKRSEQINIRLTSYEKLLLTNKAADLGFKGISDLIRTTIIRNLLKAT